MQDKERALDGDAAVRQNLQERLLDAVKQCQIHFGARQEMATETDMRVATLCLEWEAVLLHGCKRPKTKPPLKQFAGLAKSEVSLWPLAQLCLSPDEIQRFHSLSHVRSDVGRGRAWLRAAINERTLETSLQLILANNSKLQLLYEPESFLLDQERSSMLPIMAAGLSSILFSIPVDANYLNTPARNLDTPTIATPLPTSSATSALLTISTQHNSSEVVAVRKKRRKRPSHSPPAPGGAGGSPLEGGMQKSEEASPPPGDLLVGSGEGVAHQDRGSSENLSSSPSVTSLNSELEVGVPRFVALDAALLGNHSSSEAEAEAAVSATAMVLSATLSSSSSSPMIGPRQTQQGRSNVSSQGEQTLSAAELREALLAMVKTKEELEEANKQLVTQLQEVRLERDQLMLELSQSRAELTSLHSARATQQALERENDLLKEQLKLMVQRKNSTLSPADSSDNGSVPSGDHTAPSDPPTPLAPHPPLPHNDKLSEMADMYGEIVELNDRLQRDMAHKDNYITRLINTIQEAGLRVPPLVLPVKKDQSEDKDQLEKFVSVWIPSVIKRGRGPDAHHTYQVFVRIRDQEWNVYRRYAEFREFHKQLQQCIPEISTFQFPPKKALGNKSAHLVEERRQRLQEYLRVVMRLCTQPRSVQGKRRRHLLDPIMKPDIDRETLQDMLPFFKEDMSTSTPAASSRTDGPSYSGL